jgi:hypothetical protein
METITETPSYYQEADFLEYNSIFKNLEFDITKFVNSLNYVISEKEKPCDMFGFLKKMYKTSKPHFDTIIKFLKIVEKKKYDYYVSPNYNTIGVYLFCKFLLLNEDKKHHIHTAIERLTKLGIHLNIIDDILIQRSYIDVVKNYSLDKFLEEAFSLSEDDVLSDFMTCYDALNQYQRLDIENIQNIIYQIDHYCNDLYITNFIDGIYKYYRLKFLINLNECLAQTTTPLLYDGINSLQDFKRKFKINKIMYMRLYNYLTSGYSYFKETQWNGNISDEQFVQIFNSIPNDEPICPDNHDDFYEIEPNSDVYVGRFINRYFIRNENSFMLLLQEDSYNKKIDLFLQKQLKYNTLYPNDILYKYMFGLKNMDKMLKNKYKDYYKSELYNSLSTLSLVSIKAFSTFRDTQDTIYYELEQYLNNILEQNQYTRFIYNIYE